MQGKKKASEGLLTRRKVKNECRRKEKEKNLQGKNVVNAKGLGKSEDTAGKMVQF